MIIMKRVIPFIIIILLLLVIKNNISSIIDSVNNTDTTSSLSKQLGEEKKKNQYLKERLFYVKTNQFVEDQAKEKLGYLRPGEFFVIAPTPAPSEAKSVVIDDRPNWKRWIELFF